MGHQRLSTLPDTAPWRRVVGLIADDADVAAVAQATTHAALRGLDLAHNDPGLTQTVHLLTQVVLAARQPDFCSALQQVGLRVVEAPDVFSLIGGFSATLDQRIGLAQGRTDIGEMAQLAAVESLTNLVGLKASSLYGTTSTEVHQATYELSTRHGFATLAHDFFARFTQRFLTYHLAREVSCHVGGNGRFADGLACDDFGGQLAIHCHETAAIMRDYAGDWYSKHNFLGGIDADKARRFANRSVGKVAKELQRRGQRHG